VADRQPDQPSLAPESSMKAPHGTAPVDFIGGDVVLEHSSGAAGATADAYDLWDPSRTGGYTESWDSTVVRTFGSRRNGGAIYAQIRDPKHADALCLALLTPATPFKVAGKVCGVPEPTEHQGGISPDGRWLAYPVAGSSKVVMFDVNGLFTGPPEPQVFDLDAAAKRTFWVGDDNLVVDSGGRFVTLDPTHPEQTQPAPDGSSDGKVLIEPLTP
jgi:hypothetical protein